MDFKPKQISYFKKNDYVTYEAYPVSKHFEEDIFYFWNLKSGKKLRQFNYLIIPDTCIDIILEEKDGLLYNPIISMPFDLPTKLKLVDQFNYRGIRFKPGRIMKYLWFELTSIQNDFRHIDLGSVSFNSLEDFLEKFYKFKPGLFENKFNRFNYDPENLLKSNLSSKQKSRLFESLTGFKINSYKKIQKFHASINDPYLHFYDQSHYIKTFKNLTDLTPSNFFEKFFI